MLFRSLHAKGVEFSVAGGWLRDLGEEISIKAMPETRSGVREWSVMRAGRDIATFIETVNGAHLTLADTCVCASAARRSQVDLTDVICTLGHMLLQEARFRLDWHGGVVEDASVEVAEMMDRLVHARTSPDLQPPSPTPPCLAPAFDFGETTGGVSDERALAS